MARDTRTIDLPFSPLDFQDELKDRRIMRRQAKSIDKILGVMDAMRESVENQASIMKQMLDMEIEMSERRRTEEILDPPHPEPAPPAPAPGPRDSGDPNPNDNPSNAIGDFIRGLSVATVARQVLKGGTLLLLAPVVGEFITRLVGATFELHNVDAKFAQNFRDEITTAGIWGTLGLVFGKKVALLLAGGSLVWKYIDESLGANNWVANQAKGISDIVTPEIINTVGVILTSIFITKLPALVMGAWPLISRGLGGLRLSAEIASSAALALKGPLIAMGRGAILMATRFLPVTAAAGIAALYMSYGEDAKRWLSDQAGMSPGWSNFTVDAVSGVAAGASLGMMFGPYGAIAGAVGGLALAMGKSVWNWFRGRQAEAEKELQDKLDNDPIMQEINKVTGTGVEKTLSEAGVSVQTTTSRIIKDQVDRNSSDTNAQNLTVPQDIRSFTNEDLAARSEVLRQEIVGVMKKDMTKPENTEELERMGHYLIALRDEYTRRLMSWRAEDPVRRNNLENPQVFPGQFKTMAAKGFNTVFPELEELGRGDIFKDDSGKLPRFVIPSYSDWVRQQDSSPVPQPIAPKIETPRLLPEINSTPRPMSFDNTKTQTMIKTAEKPTNDNKPIVYAPTVNAPTSVVRGSTNYSSSSIVATGGMSDLDYGLPRSAM